MVMGLARRYLAQDPRIGHAHCHPGEGRRASLRTSSRVPAPNQYGSRRKVARRIELHETTLAGSQGVGEPRRPPCTRAPLRPAREDKNFEKKGLDNFEKETFVENLKVRNEKLHEDTCEDACLLACLRLDVRSSGAGYLNKVDVCTSSSTGSLDDRRSGARRRGSRDGRRFGHRR